MMGESDLRAKLEARRRSLAKRLGKVEANLRRPSDPDSQERAAERENDEVLEGLDAGSLSELEDIRAALARMDDGTYGVCTQCGEPIDAKRLEALPYAATCIECAS